MVRVALAACLVLAVSTAAARAADFADPGALVFTLAPEGEVTAVAALPNGDIVFAVSAEEKPGARRGRLMRLTAAGALHQVRADGAYLLALESDQTVLRVPEPRLGKPSVHTVQRVNVLTGRVTRLPALPGRWGGDFSRSYIRAITVLDDGTAVIATWYGVYAISPNGQAGRVPHLRNVGVRRAGLAALPGRRFAYAGSHALMMSDLSGARRRLVSDSLNGPIAASGDGGVLAMLRAPSSPTDSTDDEAHDVVRVGVDGVTTRLLSPADRPPSALGNGDGLALFDDELPVGEFDEGAVARTDDGALVFSDESRPGLRALVPPDSTRPRIALTQAAFATFPSGRVGYLAGVAGAVTATARRDDSPALEGHGNAAAPGEGSVMLGSLPTPGRYRLRLRLTTAVGRAETRALLDTRPILPSREARSALKSAYEASDGDEGGTEGTALGTCRRAAPRIIRCLLLNFEYTYDFDGPQPGRWSLVNGPAAWVTAKLLNDGIHTSLEPLPGFDGLTQTCLRVDADRHQLRARRHGIRVVVRMRCTGRVRVATRLRWRVGPRVGRASVTRARTLRRRQTWRLTVPLPHRAASAVRAGRRLRGIVVVRAGARTRYGVIPEEHGIPISVRG